MGKRKWKKIGNRIKRERRIDLDARTEIREEALEDYIDLLVEEVVEDLIEEKIKPAMREKVYDIIKIWHPDGLSEKIIGQAKIHYLSRNEP